MRTGKIWHPLSNRMLLSLTRWGMNPIVMEAQLERAVAFPDELSVPWQYMQRRFGFTSDSGTLMSNIILNFHQHEHKPAYMVNSAELSDDVQKSERNFYCMFHEMERLVRDT